MNRTALLILLAASTAIAAPKKGPKKEPEPPPAPKEEPPPPPPPQVTAPPRTENQRIVGVLDVRVEGVPPEISAQFQQQLETQVDTKRFWLAPRSRMHEVMSNSTKWTEGCVIGDCLREVKVQTNADIVMLASFSGSGTSYGWVITLVGTERGKVIGQTSERCDVCTVSEALSAATRATLALLDHVPQDLRTLDQPAAPRPVEVPPPAPENHRVAGGVLTGLGVALAAAGVAYYFANDHDKNGLAIAGAGGGLIVGGIVTLTF